MTDKAVALPPEAVHISTDASTLPFWEAAKQGRLVAPKCADCGTFRLPPTPFCPNCRSTNVNWFELSRLATVFSFSVVRGFPGIPDITLVPAILDLPDAPGARLVSPLVDVDPDDVYIGMSVTVDFAPISDGWQQPVFRPVLLR
ncbi:Zn-ribbon domain-containing OB-fold protein [Mycolicibacterium sp.]|uniref:Zn-ribbon domain-containing OB-fold protein n=1 Tax=Mycolicibacterium sp. TaxID=2320850 RepID=UPI001A1DCFF0|nr:Zn-ribbon domain-containing OB-fold protein [Mycolicibacterium sp.]MBJ7336513.1 Zn-ribbon domain-containing OB-fold protein [Mycolicibacterium sp.]